MKGLFFTFTLFISLSAYCVQQKNQYPSSLSIDQIMSKKELQETGIKKLTPQQQKALEQWMSNWTLHLVTQNAISNQSNSDQMNQQKNQDGSDQNQKDKNAIKGNYNAGEYIQLNDGTVYKIVSFDQFKTNSWKSSDKITVSKSKARFNPYLLTNESNGEKAIASTPTQNELKDFQTTYMIKQKENNGMITLNNGAEYQVSPADKMIIQQWDKDQPVLINPVQSNISTKYNFKIMNGNTGRSVTAKLVKQSGDSSTNNSSSNSSNNGNQTDKSRYSSYKQSQT